MLIIYTGNGKGKTSAAMGNVFRALGHGMKVAVIQFFKGDWPVVFGELESAKRHTNLDFFQLGRGFVKIMGDKKPLSVHKKAASQALKTAEKMVHSKKYDLVVLDEIIYALDYQKNAGLISMKKLIRILKKRPAKTHVILTGRNAHKALMELADLVTEMKEIKHPFQKGFPAAKGIDF